MDITTITSVFSALIYGAVTGSFINAAAMRTVAGKKWWGTERSCCDSCGKLLTPCELIPVVSYLLQGGRCRSCGAKIPARHLWAEVISSLSAGIIVYRLGLSWASIFSLAMLPYLLFHSLTDIEEQYIYDAWTYAMAITGLLLRIPGGVPALIDGVLGAASGFLVIYLICRLSRGGMGFGDALIMLGAGAFFGLKLSFVVLYGAFLTGGVLSVILLALKKVTRKTPLPLAPFFAVSALVTVLYGNEITAPFILLSPLSWPWF